MTTPQAPLRVGLVQTRTPATHAAALEHVAPLVREAAAQGARFILTPEGVNVLQKDRAKLLPTLVSLDDDPVVQGLRDLARELDVWIDVGSALVKREDGKAANRQAVIDPSGAIVATYDKLHMFDVDLPPRDGKKGETARESATYEPGDRAAVVETPLATFGLTICYDMRFPALHRALALGGAQILTVPAAFTRPTGEAHWDILLRARAIETGSFVIAAAQGGFHEDGRGTWGRSIAIGPWGEVIGKLDHDAPGVLIADLDLAAVDKARAAIPALKNARAFTGP
ncbi:MULTISPECIES: carbon-nitrogen hydrolase family protein [Caulobacter]|jgi:predicted amidohydrolase|uniref:carbon-nitrogen hydrolase family protein n=1 Tax=Caulobacter TaxID=75 RepID=UPI0006FD1A1C|nr:MULTISPECIES: carbon-nitrogen hydrolase family protein [Caulobacter]KQZ31469.1 amidohydrolase [Caulobacter sp. Root1472]GGL28643.1 carbon-nitrogen hydrolase [Caulobacter rhizosphaerae]